MQVIDPLKFRTDMFTWIVRGAILAVLAVLVFIFNDELREGKQLVILLWKQGLFGWRTLFFLLIFFGIPTLAGILAWRYLGRGKAPQRTPVPTQPESDSIHQTVTVRPSDPGPDPFPNAIKLTPPTIYPRLNVDPPSTQKIDPSDRGNRVKGEGFTPLNIPDRWEPKNGRTGQPDICPFLDLKGGQFARFDFVVDVVGAEFNFVIKLMTAHGQTLSGSDLFRARDEVALDFRRQGGVQLLYHRMHQEFVPFELHPSNPTRFKVTVEIVKRWAECLQVTIDGRPVVYAFPMPKDHKNQIALITWSKGGPYDMAFTEMRLGVRA